MAWGSRIQRALHLHLKLVIRSKDNTTASSSRLSVGIMSRTVHSPGKYLARLEKSINGLSVVNISKYQGTSVGVPDVLHATDMPLKVNGHVNNTLTREAVHRFSSP